MILEAILTYMGILACIWPLSSDMGLVLGISGLYLDDFQAISNLYFLPIITIWLIFEGQGLDLGGPSLSQGPVLGHFLGEETCI